MNIDRVEVPVELGGKSTQVRVMPPHESFEVALLRSGYPIPCTIQRLWVLSEDKYENVLVVQDSV